MARESEKEDITYGWMAMVKFILWALRDMRKMAEFTRQHSCGVTGGSPLAGRYVPMEHVPDSTMQEAIRCIDGEQAVRLVIDNLDLQHSNVEFTTQANDHGLLLQSALAGTPYPMKLTPETNAYVLERHYQSMDQALKQIIPFTNFLRKKVLTCEAHIVE